MTIYYHLAVIVKMSDKTIHDKKKGHGDLTWR